MFIVRMPFVIKDRIQSFKIRRVRIQPRVNVLGLDIDNRPVVAGGSDFGLSSLDPTVTDALKTQVTSCANLGA